ncbi:MULTISPECIES: phenylalanine--tRNA ligase subunit beta [unclassified Microcoleus]|uniref:phenylalanine--tRNA ligase subunit beta n=1 Tax=unclassified Microcoleus TaxID=2642155 RepID=UPI001E0FC7D3|nr:MULTISPECIES: phenylalanine--tRNA ligase subunit beta [unclassified Microcoleus]MCC3411463.1 phenylalanine--tRNA ligase subunit beta [Microcoleus sp. PH2017_02_FOX_O_A]MCC3513990.1 phenylalanine--tRNA ligase subunit beta [Microcoleus sp. PH2017_18_LLB_O_A]
MRISLNWLRELVDVTSSPEELAETLTMAGFEVEEIEDRRAWADGVVLGKIVACEQHPNADKLRVCQVDVGKPEPLNIVCGAPNARADIYVPVAVVGTFLSTIDLKIKPAKLRGVPSEGMICSLAELGLLKESAGIHIFDLENPELGSDIRPLLGLDDVILDLTATANRADALSMVGVAREVAALTGASLRIPTTNDVAIHGEKSPNLAVEISELQGCPIYIGTEISGVKIAPSPAWLQQRLQAAGVRPISNVVDVTNYILLEWGQPLHAFDRDRLQSFTGTSDISIGVRFAKPGESFKTLDGQNRNLQPQNLLITASDKPVALAGVMGGEDTEVYEGTVNLVLEAAIFDQATIRRSARAQGLRSEASIRYERGVNQAALTTACDRAIALILQLAGGTATVQKTASSGEDMSFSRSIELRLDRINLVLGQLKRGATGGSPYLEPEEVKNILTALGCEVAATEKARVFAITVPPYRYRDLEREIDLIEEVARLHGYDNFCDTLPSETEPGYLSPEYAQIRNVRSAFRAAGLTELMHYSLVKTEGDNQVVLANPLFVEYSALRTEMLSGSIDAFQYNLEQGNGALNGFEVGRIFWKEGDAKKEADAVAGIIGGDPTVWKWQQGGRDRPLTWFEAKGVLESVFQQLSLAVEYASDSSNPRLHPGRTAALSLNGKRLGVFGQLHPQLQQEKGLPEQVYVFQLDLGVLLGELGRSSTRASLTHNSTRKFAGYSSFPASDRDIAFFAPVEVPVVEMQGAMKQAAGSLLDSVELFDEYRGENVPAGQRSLAFRLVYRSGDRTLSESDVEPAQQKVRDVLVEKFGVSLRS